MNNPKNLNAKGLNPKFYRRKMRIKLLTGALLLFSFAIGLVLMAFQESIVFFHGPSDVKSGLVEQGRNFRLGGLVEENSVTQDQSGHVHFKIGDGVHQVPVVFNGILPDLFREGQGVVTLGHLEADGTFIAEEVLAKHDENYMPAEVVEAMKQAGTWQGK